MDYKLNPKYLLPAIEKEDFFTTGLPSIPQPIFDYIRKANEYAQLMTGIRVIVNQYAPDTRREQFRFPRSKKARIRKKWRKKPENWREVDARGDVYLIGSRTSVAVMAMHKDGYDLLKKTVGVIRNCKVE